MVIIVIVGDGIFDHIGAFTCKDIERLPKMKFVFIPHIHFYRCKKKIVKKQCSSCVAMGRYMMIVNSRSNVKKRVKISMITIQN